MASHTGDFFGTHRSDLTLYREENVGVFIAYSGGMKRNSWHIYDVLDAYLVDVALGLKPSLNYTTGKGVYGASHSLTALLDSRGAVSGEGGS